MMTIIFLSIIFWGYNLVVAGSDPKTTKDEALYWIKGSNRGCDTVKLSYKTYQRQDYLIGGFKLSNKPTWYLDVAGWDWGHFGLRLGHLEGAPEIPSKTIISVAGVSIRQPLMIKSKYLIDIFAIALGPGGSLSAGENEGGVLSKDDINFVDVGLRYVRNYLALSLGYRWAFTSFGWSKNATPEDRANYDLSVPDGVFLGISFGLHKVKNRIPEWKYNWNKIACSQSHMDYFNFSDKYPKAPKNKEAKKRLIALEPMAFSDAKKSNSLESFREYADIYPNGPNIIEAGKIFDSLAWEQALIDASKVKEYTIGTTTDEQVLHDYPRCVKDYHLGVLYVETMGAKCQLALGYTPYNIPNLDRYIDLMQRGQGFILTEAKKNNTVPSINIKIGDVKKTREGELIFDPEFRIVCILKLENRVLQSIEWKKRP
jgi:hypothetical protein